MSQPDWMAGWKAENSAARGAAAASRAPGDLDPGPLGGFVASAISAIPEMFGQDPTKEATIFRQQNPVGGIVSELASTLIPYAGIEVAVAKIPRLAQAVTKGTEWAGRGFGLAKSGITALENPVAYGAVREMVKFAPWEIGRLGVGLATAPEDNWGNLFADVGLSTVLAGGFGGIGGFFRAGGKLTPQTGRVVGADMGLAPFAELRMANTPGAEAIGGGALEGVRADLTKRVLFETPAMNVPNGVKARYITSLENGTPETDALVNVLFAADASKGTKSGLDRRLLAEGSEGDARTLDVGQQQNVLAALGFADVEDLAQTVRYPRQVEVKSDRAAGMLAKALDDSPGLQSIGSGVLIGRQADEGLWVVAKRIEAPEAAKKTFGGQQIATGDKWFVGLTDKPQRFAKDLMTVAESNISAWAKMREAYQPSRRTDLFSKGMDEALQVLLPKDPEMMQKMGRKRWVGGFSERLMNQADPAGALAGITNSAQARAMADALYDAFQPTMFKEARNPAFGRFFGLLRGTQILANERVSRIVKGRERIRGSGWQAAAGKNIEFESGFHGHQPVSKLWGELWEHDQREFQLVVKAAMSKTPGEELAKLSADGTISPRATELYTQLQAINGSVWEELLPVFKDTELEGKFALLDGYILPRVFKGDWYQQVVDDKGRLQWLASGKSRGATQAEAQAIIDEASSRGMNWQLGKDELKGARLAAEIDDLSAINQMVDSRIAGSAETKDVVEAALRRLDGQRQGKTGVGGVPKRMTEARTGVAGSADNDYSLDDIIKQTEDHYRRLYRFAGQHSWHRRWEMEASNVLDKTSHQDLMRKAAQYVGREGEITNALNKVLEPVLGKVMGGKPATRIAQATSELMYNWNLAILNPTFALLNVLQPLQTVLPAIAFLQKAPPQLVADMYHVMPQIDAAGKFVGVAAHMNPVKVLSSATRLIGQPDDEFRAIMERASADGTLMHSQVDEWLGPKSLNATTIRETFQQQGGWEGIKRVSTLMADRSEQYSRMVSAAAMYKIGKGHFNLEGDQLYRFVQRGVHVTNFGYGVVDRPRVFTGPLGSMFGLFKNWQFHFINQMVQYAGMAARNPLSLDAWAPLLWQGGAALAVGGLGATPLKMAADGLANWHDGSDSSFQWLQKHWGGHEVGVGGADLGDVVYFGLPAFLGASLQSSATIPGTDVRNETANLMNFVFIERAKLVGKAIGTATGMGDAADQNALRNPNVRDQLFNALAPRAAIRLAASVEGDYIKSMGTGLPQVRDVGPSSRLLHGLGFNQVEIEQQQVAARELYKDQDKTRKVVKSLGAWYADAMARGDTAEMEHLVNRALLQSVPIDSVMKSAMTQQGREEGDAMDRFKEEKVMRYMEAEGLKP